MTTNPRPEAIAQAFAECCEGPSEFSDTPADFIRSVEQRAREIEAAQDSRGEDYDTHHFKNFHRLLCERFGYCHDEVDWRRDQLSLIEHIDRRLSTHRGAVDDATSDDLVLCSTHGNWHRTGCPYCIQDKTP